MAILPIEAQNYELEIVIGVLALIAFCIRTWIKTEFNSRLGTKNKLITKAEYGYLISKIEEAKAQGKGGVDFEYQKKKDDYEKLLSFGNKCFDAEKTVTQLCLTIITAASDAAYKPQLFSRDKLTSLIQNSLRSEAESLLDESDLMYRIYYKRYENTEFCSAFEHWYQAIGELINKSESLIGELTRLLENQNNDDINILTEGLRDNIVLAHGNRLRVRNCSNDLISTFETLSATIGTTDYVD